MKVIITGDSHTAALHKGLAIYKPGPSSPHDISFLVVPLGAAPIMRKPFFSDQPDCVRIKQSKHGKDMVELPARDGSPPARYGLCGVFHSRWLYRKSDWKGYGTLADENGRLMISQSLLKRVINDDLKYMMGFLAALKKHGGDVFAIESPYPFKHDMFVKSLGAGFVLDLNAQYRKIARDRLGELQVPVVGVPPDCIDEHGFMRNEFRSPIKTDMHHANAEFGALMLGEIARFLGSRPGNT